MDPNITTASLKAVVGALERLGVDLAPTGDLAGAGVGATDGSAGAGSQG